MPKYYVNSGSLRCVLDAPNETEAIQNALSGCKIGTELGQIIRINEEGFGDWEHKTDVFFSTIHMLTKLGIDLR